MENFETFILVVCPRANISRSRGAKDNYKTELINENKCQARAPMLQGETVELECGVESWPRSVNYWEKDGRVLASDKKYSIEEKEHASVQYKFT